MPATATVVEEIVEQAERLARESAMLGDVLKQVKGIVNERDEASKQLSLTATRVYELEDELADAQAEGEGRVYSRAIDLLLDIKRGLFTVDEVLATLADERAK